MSYEPYVKAVEKLKEMYPEYKDVKFELCNGELSYCYSSLIQPPIDMKLMQQEINKILGQKVYQYEYKSTHVVYATSEDEAREFLKSEKYPNLYLNKVYEKQF